MMTEPYATPTAIGYPIEICLSCETIMAGSEWQDDRDGGPRDAHVARMTAAQPGAVDLTPNGPDYDTDPDGGVVTFSRSRCDGCGETDAGTRVPAVVWFPRDDQAADPDDTRSATDRALDHAVTLGVDPVNLDDASVILPDSGGWISITEHARHGWQTVTVYDRHGRIVRQDEDHGPSNVGRLVAQRAGVLAG